MDSLENLTLPQLLEHTRKLEKDSALYNTLVNDPATRAETLALVKKKYPQTSIPEIDVKVAADAAIAAERTEREKLEVKVRDLEFSRRLDAERDRVTKQYDLSDADLLAVEALMMDKEAPIPHFDAAVKVHKASKRAAEPSSAQLTPRLYDMPEKEKWGAGVGNKVALNKIFAQEAYAALSEVRGHGKAA